MSEFTANNYMNPSGAQCPFIRRKMDTLSNIHVYTFYKHSAPRLLRNILQLQESVILKILYDFANFTVVNQKNRDLQKSIQYSQKPTDLEFSMLYWKIRSIFLVLVVPLGILSIVFGAEVVKKIQKIRIDKITKELILSGVRCVAHICLIV